MNSPWLPGVSLPEASNQLKWMKRKAFPLIIAISLCSGTLHSQEIAPSTGRIRISVENLRNSKGFVGVALFNAKKGFPDKPEAAVDGRSIKAGETAEIVFDHVPYGTYAISVLHDENGNRKMDKNIIGIPKEGFGTSNNPRIRRGPPTFEDSRVQLDRHELALKIDMNYF